MLTIRTNEEIDLMIAFLRNHKVRFTPRIKSVIRDELRILCEDFKIKSKRIKNAPDWMY